METLDTSCQTAPSQVRSVLQSCKASIVEYQRSHAGRATWQVVNSLGSYIALWVAMYFTVNLSWWLTLALAVLAGAFLVRVFIIFHDCGHGSFYRSRVANDALGIVTGLLTFTSYYHWRGEHAVHHGTSGNLDRRGTGDIWTLTVAEYREASHWKRFCYRVVRHPVVLLGIAPLVLFLFLERWPRAAARRHERLAIWWTNLLLPAMVIGMSLLFGFVPYLVIQLTVLAVTAGAGVWLFHLQHQFEDTYWATGKEWDFSAAALQGSSFFKLPRVLQWFSGNIGFHHIHHLSPRIPNYHLERCYKSTPALQDVEPVTIRGGLRSLNLGLWDEESKKLVGFGHARRLERAG